MFETVAPARASERSRSALYEGLSFSLAVHFVAAVAAVASNLWQVTFPNSSPSYTIAFVLESAPPPPPPPPPPAKPLEQKVELTATKIQVPADVLAPTIIPDEIPVVPPTQISSMKLASLTGVVGGIDTGVDQGLLGGKPEGEVGGSLSGTVGGVLTEINDGRVHIARDKKLPMLPLSQVYPSYPEDARMRAWEDELVVRYVIGKDGRVKDVSVVSAPQRELFIDGTLRAIRTWRFKPMMKDGERTEVVHELTVYYRLDSAS